MRNAGCRRTGGVADAQKAVLAVAIGLADALEAFGAVGAFGAEITGRSFALAVAALKLARADMVLVAIGLDRDEGFAFAEFALKASLAEMRFVAAFADARLQASIAGTFQFGRADVSGIAGCTQFDVEQLAEAVGVTSRRALAGIRVVAGLPQIHVLLAVIIDAFRRRAAKLVIAAGVAQIHMFLAGLRDAFETACADMRGIAAFAEFDVEQLADVIGVTFCRVFAKLV